MEESGCCSTSAGESNCTVSIFEGSQAFFQSQSGWVAATGVIEVAVELADVFLGIGGGEMDRNIDTAVNGLRVLAGMNSLSAESWVFVREVGSLWELFILDLGFSLLVEHVEIGRAHV